MVEPRDRPEEFDLSILAKQLDPRARRQLLEQVDAVACTIEQTPECAELLCATRAELVLMEVATVVLTEGKQFGDDVSVIGFRSRQYFHDRINEGSQESG